MKSGWLFLLTRYFSSHQSTTNLKPAQDIAARPLPHTGQGDHQRGGVNLFETAGSRCVLSYSKPKKKHELVPRQISTTAHYNPLFSDHTPSVLYKRAVNNGCITEVSSTSTKRE